MSQSHAAVLRGKKSCTPPPRSPVLFPAEEGGGGSWKVVVPNAGHGATRGKVQTCRNIKEKLVFPRSPASIPARPRGWLQPGVMPVCCCPLP